MNSNRSIRQKYFRWRRGVVLRHPALPLEFYRPFDGADGKVKFLVETTSAIVFRNRKNQQLTFTRNCNTSLSVEIGRTLLEEQYK